MKTTISGVENSKDLYGNEFGHWPDIQHDHEGKKSPSKLSRDSTVHSLLLTNTASASHQ